MQQRLSPEGSEHFGVHVAARGKTTRLRQAAGENCGGSHPAGSAAQILLRSRTLYAPRLQLRTYHDNATMREALERLKRTCFPFSLDEEEELLKMDSARNNLNVGRAQLGQISGHVIVYCFAFCDLRSLCELGCVNRRFAALSNAHHLWEMHAHQRRVPTRAPEFAREDFRRAVLERSEMWEAELQRHQVEYMALERRLQERTAAERAAPLNVDAALSNKPPESFRNGSSSINIGGVGSNHSATENEALRSQLEQLESTKLNLLRDVRELKSTLEQQKRQIDELREWMVRGASCRVAGEEEEEGITTRSESGTLTFLDVQLFERRICRIVLGTAADLPLVLRRGVVDFGTMELLCLHGRGDVGEIARQRWAAFKRFFPPLSEDYGTLRAFLSTGETPTPLERTRECIARLGGVIRRVQRMTDDEIVQIVM